MRTTQEHVDKKAIYEKPQIEIIEMEMESGVMLRVSVARAPGVKGGGFGHGGGGGII